MPPEITKGKVQEKARQGEVEPRKTRKRKGRMPVLTTAITLVDSISFRNKGPNPQQISPAMGIPEPTMSEEEPAVLEKQNPPAETITQPITAEEQPVNNPPISESLVLTREEETLVNTKNNVTLVLPGDNGIIFVENMKAAGIPEPTSEDSREDKGDEESDDKYFPPTAEETKQNDLEPQVYLRFALSVFKAKARSRTLDSNAAADIQRYVPLGLSEQDKKRFMIKSIDYALIYWNNNSWDLPLVEAKELVEVYKDMRMHNRYYNPERARQEILSYFNLIY